MVRKNQIYGISTVLWAVASFGTAIVLYSGNAEPYVSPSQLPGGATPVGLFGSGLAAAFLGWLVIGFLRSRSWRKMARRAGFDADGRLLPVGQPGLSKTVRGRPVRVGTVSRGGTGGGESGSGKTTYTRVEAELAGPAEEGLVVNRDGVRTDLGNLESVTVAGHEVVGPENLARDVLSSRVQGVLDEASGVDSVTVGDAAGALSDAAPDVSDSLLGRLAKSTSEAAVAGDESTATVETEGLLLDADELEGRVDAVVAVADAFETATADGDPG